MNVDKMRIGMAIFCLIIGVFMGLAHLGEDLIQNSRRGLGAHNHGPNSRRAVWVCIAWVLGGAALAIYLYFT